MNIRHIQKYEYIPENIRKSNLKWKLSSPDERGVHELPEKMDKARMHENGDCHEPDERNPERSRV